MGSVTGAGGLVATLVAHLRSLGPADRWSGCLGGGRRVGDAAPTSGPAARGGTLTQATRGSRPEPICDPN